MSNNHISLKTNAIMNVINQICLIIFPLITFSYASHILGATNIGIFSYSNSIKNYFLYIAGLGISIYAIREGTAKRDNIKEISTFSNEIFTINIISTIISLILLCLLIVSSESLNTYRIFILIDSISIVLKVIGVDWINSIYEDYFYITVRNLAIQIVSLLAMLLLVKDKDALMIYTAITVVSSSGGYLINYFYVRKYIKIKITLKPKFNKHLISMLVLFANTMAITVYTNSDITVLGIITNDETVGVYSMAAKIYTMVKTVINAIITVTIPRFAYLIGNNREMEYKKQFNQIFDSLIYISIPCAVGLALASKNILFIFGGSEYLNGGYTLAVLSASLIFAVLACLYSNSVLILYHRENIFLTATIVAAMINISLNFLVIPFCGSIGAAITTFVCEVIVFTVSMTKSRDKVSISIDKHNLFSEILGAVLISAICLIVNKMFNVGIIPLLIEIVLSEMMYIVITLSLKNTNIDFMRKILRQR